MADHRDTEVLQVFRCEVRKNRLVYLVVAESRLIPSEAKAPQPDHDVHNEKPNLDLPHIIALLGKGVQDDLDTLPEIEVRWRSQHANGSNNNNRGFSGFFENGSGRLFLKNSHGRDPLVVMVLSARRSAPDAQRLR